MRGLKYCFYSIVVYCTAAFLMIMNEYWVTYKFFAICILQWHVCHLPGTICFPEITVEPRYNEVFGTMKITLLYQFSHYIRVKQQRNIKSWDQKNDLVIRGFCYIRPRYNEVPLYCITPIQSRYFHFLLKGKQYCVICVFNIVIVYMER